MRNRIIYWAKIGLLVTCFNQVSFGQIGIGTTTPDASSIVDVTSQSSGILIPRMLTSEREAIVSPALGLLIYNLDNNCIEVNKGNPSVPVWSCLGSEVSSEVQVACSVNGFEGSYANGFALTSVNKFSITLTNNGFSDANINFLSSDLVLSGVLGISVGTPSVSSSTLSPGQSVLVEYPLTGTPSSDGELKGVWSKLALTCFKMVSVLNNGAANFTLPLDITVVSISNSLPPIDLQGVIDNTTNQITVNIPYTSGIGTYDADTSVYVLNNSGTGEGNDFNRFRVMYPAGTFSTSGSIEAIIEVDGDELFNVKKQLLEANLRIVELDFKVNGVSQGQINLNANGGIVDRNFANVDHKFIYKSVIAKDGRTWLNNNLGAHYTNINHLEFNPSQQATAHTDYFAYGSLFQWGRDADGHEIVNYTSPSVGTSLYGITFVNASTDTPGHNLFIAEPNEPRFWRIPNNDNLWQGVDGINNPCPVGYRLPTDAEIANLLVAEGIVTDIDAANSSLAFTVSGTQNGGTGNVESQGSFGYIWSSTVNVSGYSESTSLNGVVTSGVTNHRYGYSCRCIKD